MDAGTSVTCVLVWETLNYKSMLNFFSTLWEANSLFNCKEVHQVSTDKVYGDLPLSAAAPGFKETDQLRPSSPYSSLKAAADLAVLSYHRTYGIPVTIGRSSNNYGRFQHPEKLIPKMIQLALKNKPLPPVSYTHLMRGTFLHWLP